MNKKLIALVLAFAMVFSSFTAAFADTTTAIPVDAQAAKDLGMLIGEGNGVTTDYLATTPTRLQAAIMFLRLKGLEQTALSYTSTKNFADANQVKWEGGRNIMAYLNNNPQLGWVGIGANKLNPNVAMTSTEFYKVMLETLGYKQNTAEVIGDFTWDGVRAFAATKGLSKVVAVNSFTVNDLATATIETLKATVKGSTKTLATTLVESGVINADAAVAAGVYTKAPVVTAVTSVTALNTMQVQIVFNGTVDKTAAEDIANYSVFNAGSSTNLVTAGSAVLKADGKTVVITLGTALNNGTAAKVVVKNIATYTNDAVVVADTTIPTVVGAVVTGPQTITVEYSEPITNINSADYTVDNGNYMVTGAVANGSSKVDVTVGVNLTAGQHTINFSGVNVKDYAGYKVLATSSTFTAAPDTTLPTVSVKSVSPTEVKLVFSKPVVNVANVNVLYRHSYNSNTFQIVGDAAGFVTAVSSTEYTLDFSTKTLPLGANNLYIAYTSSTGTQIQDLWGNKLAATTLPINVTLDTTKPTVKEVKFVDNATLKVIFSEKLDQLTAENEANYTVKDSAGDIVTLASAVRGGTANNEVTLDFGAGALGGGSYTVAIKGIKDDAFVKNVMDQYSTTLSVTDTVKPTVGTATWSDDNAGIAKVYVPFSEKMDVTKLVKANIYKNVNGAGFVVLSDKDTVAVAADGKSVVITIDNNSVDVTSIGIRFGAITDVAGNGFAGIIATSTTDFAINADAITIAKVEATGTKTLKVTFDGRLSSVSAAGFTLWNKTTDVTSNIGLSVVSHEINSDNQSVVTFNLGTAIGANAKAANGNVYEMLIGAGATGTKSFLGTQVSTVVHNAATAVVVDKIAPTATTLTFVDANTMTITFKEALKATTFAATLNGFSVANGTSDLKLTGVVLEADGVTVTLTGAGFVKDSTTVSYTSVAGITDAAGNALANIVNLAQ